MDDLDLLQQEMLAPYANSPPSDDPILSRLQELSATSSAPTAPPAPDLPTYDGVPQTGPTRSETIPPITPDVRPATRPGVGRFPGTPITAKNVTKPVTTPRAGRFPGVPVTQLPTPDTVPEPPKEAKPVSFGSLGRGKNLLLDPSIDIARWKAGNLSNSDLAKNIAANIKEAGDYPMTPELVSVLEQIEKSESLYDTAKILLSNPSEGMSLLGEAGMASLPSMIAAGPAAKAGAVTGGKIGSFFGPAGATAGGVTGGLVGGAIGVAGGSYSVEYAAGILEYMESKGVPLWDEKAIEQFLSVPENAAAASDFADKGAAEVAKMDAAGTIAGGAIGLAAARSMRIYRLAQRVAAARTAAVAGAVGASGAEAVTGGLGERNKQLAQHGRIVSQGQINVEALLEGVVGVPEVGIAATVAGRNTRSATPQTSTKTPTETAPVAPTPQQEPAPSPPGAEGGGAASSEVPPTILDEDTAPPPASPNQNVTGEVEPEPAPAPQIEPESAKQGSAAPTPTVFVKPSERAILRDYMQWTDDEINSVESRVEIDQELANVQQITNVVPDTSLDTQEALAVEEARITPAKEAGTKAQPVVVKSATDTDTAAQQIETTPSEQQKEAGNYRKAHVRVHDFDVTLETAKGATRTGTSPSGKPWSVVMPAHYGYIKRTTGADGDHVDVYVGSKPKARRVFVVDQYDPKTRQFDEHKVILGVGTKAEATKLYDGGFSDGSGPARRRNVHTLTQDAFKTWLREGDQTKPYETLRLPREKPATLLPDEKSEAVRKIVRDEGLSPQDAAERITMIALSDDPVIRAEYDKIVNEHVPGWDTTQETQDVKSEEPSIDSRAIEPQRRKSDRRQTTTPPGRSDKTQTVSEEVEQQVVTAEREQPREAPQKDADNVTAKETSRPKTNRRTTAPAPAPGKTVRPSDDSAGKTAVVDKKKREYALTPAAHKKRRTIENTVTDIVRQVAGWDVAIRLPKEPMYIGDGAKEAAVASGGSVGDQIAGYYDKDTSLIVVSLADNVDKVLTAYHESWHHLQDRLTKSEVATLTRELPRLTDIVRRDQKHSAESVAAISPSEIMADAFAIYAKKDQRKAGFPISVRRIFDKLLTLLRRTRNALRGAGFKTAEDIFSKALLGELKQRQSVPSADSRIMYAIPPTTGRASPRAQSVGATRARPSSFLAKHADTFRYLGANAGNFVSTTPALDHVVRQLQDKFVVMRRYQQAVTPTTGTLPEHLDVHMAEALSHGEIGGLIEEVQEEFLDPVDTILRENNLAAEELGLYMHAMHAEERNTSIFDVNPALLLEETDTNGKLVQSPGGSGMTDKQAQTVLATFASQKVKDGSTSKDVKLREAAELIWRMNKEALKRRYDAGLLDGATYQQLATKWKYYVPLKGFAELAFDEGSKRDLRTGQGYDIRGREFQQALGRTSMPENPYLHSIINSHESIIRSGKNRVGQAFRRFIRAHPRPEMYHEVKTKIERKVNDKTGIVETRAVPIGFARDAENVIGVKVGGKTSYIAIHDPLLLKAMTNASVETIGSMTRFFGKFTRLFSALQTSLNPPFVIANFVRDLMTANVIMGEQQVAGLRRKVMKDVFPAVRGAFLALRGDRKNQWAKTFVEYREDGGKISFFDFQTIEKLQARAEKNMTRSDATRAVVSIFEFIEDINSAVENGVRLATYKHLRDAGYSRAKAAHAGRELTVNFNRKGELGPQFNAMFAFFNASMQGNIRLWTAVAKNKTVRRSALGFMVAGFMMELLNAAISGENEDSQELYYDEIENYVKETNFVLMIPGSDKKITFPLGYGLNVLYNIGRSAASLAIRGRGDPVKEAVKTVNSTFSVMSPIGSAPSIMQFIAPTAIDPFVQVGENVAWHGGPIRPHRYGPSDTRPKASLHFKRVNPLSRELAQYVNEATGGNEYYSGYLDYSPEDIEHFAEYFAGGAGRFINRVAKLGWAAAMGDQVELHDVPFVRKVFTGGRDVTQRVRYYETRNSVKAAHDAVRRMRKAGVDGETIRQFREDHAVELRAHAVFRYIEKRRKVVRKKMSRIEEDQSLSRREREDALEKLREKDTQIMNQAMRRLKKIQAEQE